MNALNFVVKRMQEPSSYAGVAAIAGVVQDIAHVGVAHVSVGLVVALLSGIVAFLSPEKGSTK